MALTLRIENVTSLPDGGPLSYTVTGARGFDIGRDAYLDWSLPDETRYISGKHCEVRVQDGAYVLYDVSTNGTFLNGSDRRMHGPHVLADGDRLLIGDYIIRVELNGSSAASPAAPEAGGDVWGGEAAVPPSRRSEVAPRPVHPPARPDFLEWAMDLPAARPPPAAAPDPAPGSVWVDSTPGGAWAARDALPPSVAAPVVASADPWHADGAAPAAPPPRASPPAAPQPAVPAPLLAPPPSVHEALEALARGAGVPADAFMRRDSAGLMEEVGATLRVTAEQMMRLLSARAGVKRTIRSAEHTTIGALDNNPFKFSPTVEDALRIAFGPPTRSYLNGRTAFQRGFEDISNHQVRIFSAMQMALNTLMADLEPAAIERLCGAEKGVAALLSSRKARLWDLYCTTWRAKAQHGDTGMVGLFLLYFSECYDRLGQQGRGGG